MPRSNVFLYDYDAGRDEYAYSLRTQGFAQGMYRLEIDLGDGQPAVVALAVR